MAPFRPALGVPVPAEFTLGVMHRPDHHMRSAGTDFVVAAGATIDLDGPRAGYRDHFVVMSVRSLLDPVEHQNSRNSSLSIPRMES